MLGAAGEEFYGLLIRGAGGGEGEQGADFPG